MTFAVIKTGGKQYIVQAGRYIMIEKLPNVKVGDKVEFDILLLDDGSKTTVGTPAIAGKKAVGKVLEHSKDEKKVVIKYKAKSRYFKKRGHRQPITKVSIDAL